MNTLNPSIKYHLLVGLSLSIWTFLFAFVARPFEHGNMNFEIWVYVSVGFALMVFLCYALMSIIQSWIYQKLLRWSIGLEVLSYVFFYVIYSVATYLVYKSSFINGPYNFIDFLVKVVLTSSLIYIPIIILSRKYLIKLLPVKEDVLTIKGENKLDILKVKKSQLIGVSNAQNYVEVFYVQNNELQSKLIRASLKKMQEDLDFLIQIHRSHLINPTHFRSWKNSNTILLTQMELPVSKNYKDNLMSL